MQNSSKLKQTVTRLFVYTDARNWGEVEAQFASEVNLDYSSMTGNPESKITPSQITDSWKSVLPGFSFTQHQLGNFLIEEKDSTAHVFCYGTAVHTINEAEDGIWTVYGSYDFDLALIGEQWVITSMTFNYNGQSGNSALIQQAIENAK